jgi:hypothetical protein
MFADDAVYEHSGALYRRLPPGLTRTTTHANSYVQKLFTNSYTSHFSNLWIILSDASKCFVSAFSLYEKLFEASITASATVGYST